MSEANTVLFKSGGRDNVGQKQPSQGKIGKVACSVAFGMCKSFFLFPRCHFQSDFPRIRKRDHGSSCGGTQVCRGSRIHKLVLLNMDGLTLEVVLATATLRDGA